MSQPTLCIRCDGSDILGMGHVLRTLTLARAFQRAGGAVLFLLSEPHEPAHRLLAGAGVPFQHLGFRSAQTRLSCEDAEAVVAHCRRLRARWALIDHYGAGGEYIAALKRAGLGVAVIDDGLPRDLSQVDWLLDPVNDEVGGSPAAVRGGQVLAGPRFALLRAEFARTRSALNRRFRADDRRLLLTFGGGDVGEILIRVLARLERIERRLEIRALLGRAPEDPRPLLRAASESRHDLSLHYGFEGVAEHMAWADLSVNAGGSTCWELCCMGVPMLVFLLSPDQEHVAHRLTREGCAVVLGKLDEALEAIPSAVEELFARPQRRADLSRAGASLVDGDGASRVAAHLMRVMKGGEPV